MYALLTAALLAAGASASPPSTPPAPEALAAAPELRLPRAGSDLRALALPAALLAGLGAVAVVLRRRRGPVTRRVQVLETTSLGPKRSLILAQLEGELLLLGASEAGIHLLRSRPEAEADPDGEAEPAEGPDLQAVPARADGPGPLGGLLARIQRARPRAVKRVAPEFDALLAESVEDQELRRKLARGLSGSIR